MLLWEVTGIRPVAYGRYVLLESAGVRSTQRLALGDGNVAGGLVVFTWPAELKEQALYLYSNGRAQRLLAAAREEGWDADPRPQLAYRSSGASVRVFFNPTIDIDEYLE